MPSKNLTNNSVVAITKADDYNYVKVYEAVKKSLELIGGLDRIIKQGDKVFVKINHLPPSSQPERGIITHPVFTHAVLELLKNYSSNIMFGDDIEPSDVDGYQVSGLRQISGNLGVQLINLREYGYIETKCDGLMLDKAYLSKIVLDADVIINLPKLKTHSLTVYTGGIKNMYGTLSRGQRAKFHYDYRKVEDFCQMLTDIFSRVKPRLTIMDGIVAMEGEGPGAGSLRNLGIVLASYDTVALDAVANKIIGLEPLSVLTTKWASERGLGVGNLQDIDVVGENINDVAVSDFKLPANYYRTVVSKLPAFLDKFLLNQMLIRPRVISDLCTGCFECRKICPAGAMLKTDGIARIDKDKCIQCMCCHEVCRFNAIAISRPWLGNLIHRVARLLQK